MDTQSHDLHKAPGRGWKHGSNAVLQKPPGNPPLLTTDRFEVNNFIARCNMNKAGSKFYDLMGMQLIAKAKRLVDVINKEYDLK